MKNLLTTFVIILLIASCSSPTAPDNEFDPYIVGNFKIVTPTEAEYIGEQGNQKTIVASSDTIVIDQPGKQSLKLIRDNSDDKGIFNFVFYDSTISSNGSGSDIRYIDITFPNNRDYDTTLRTMGHEVSVNEDRLRASIYADYYCNEELDDDSVILLSASNYDETPFRSWKILSDSLNEVIEQIAC